MHVIRSHEYLLKPWKNGFGKTREIIHQAVGPNLAWRLSLAVVNGDGPFSEFAGFERILTVVQGDGMRLVGQKTDYDARPFTPVRFPGCESIFGHCKSAPIENFNLIFNPSLVGADVKVVSGAAISRTNGKPDEITILHVLNGRVSCNDDLALAAQDTGVCNGIIPDLRADKDARCAVVSLAFR